MKKIMLLATLIAATSCASVLHAKDVSDQPRTFSEWVTDCNAALNGAASPDMAEGGAISRYSLLKDAYAGPATAMPLPEELGGDDIKVFSGYFFSGNGKQANTPNKYTVIFERICEKHSGAGSSLPSCRTYGKDVRAYFTKDLPASMKEARQAMRRTIPQLLQPVGGVGYAHLTDEYPTIIRKASAGQFKGKILLSYGRQLGYLDRLMPLAGALISEELLQPRQ